MLTRSTSSRVTTPRQSSSTYGISNSRATSSACSLCALAMATTPAFLQFLKPGICVVRAKPAPMIPMRIISLRSMWAMLASVAILFHQEHLRGKHDFQNHRHYRHRGCRNIRAVSNSDTTGREALLHCDLLEGAGVGRGQAGERAGRL